MEVGHLPEGVVEMGQDELSEEGGRPWWPEQVGLGVGWAGRAEGKKLE